MLAALLLSTPTLDSRNHETFKLDRNSDYCTCRGEPAAGVYGFCGENFVSHIASYRNISSSTPEPSHSFSGGTCRDGSPPLNLGMQPVTNQKPDANRGVATQRVNFSRRSRHEGLGQNTHEI